MKHPLSITALLIALFLAAQLVGLLLVFLNIQEIKEIDGRHVVEFNPTPGGEPPVERGGQGALLIIFGVGIGTALLLLLIKFRAFNVWRMWFLLAVFLAVGYAFSVLTRYFGLPQPVSLAFAVAAPLALWKVFRPGPIIHNLTEMFMYSGIVIILVKFLNLTWTVVLLLVISVYDMYAVWRSKHMVTMAKAQTEVNLFAGLYMPKKSTKKLREPAKPGSSIAILGGGDIAFPLLFSAVTMVWLIERGMSPQAALTQTLLVTFFATVALAGIFAYSKKGKFYPAMPALTVGCLLGLAIIALLGIV